MVPRPSKNNSYCCVCKIPFEDYLTVRFTTCSISIPPRMPYWFAIQNIHKGSWTCAVSSPIKQQPSNLLPGNEADQPNRDQLERSNPSANCPHSPPNAV